mmetsp:Transcript_11415/g.37773  ORF Transcript_11415/g.37773 Transcript_11415/m.37773 type:complete len:250 (-) Transcript_11415:100-849(-)
MERSCSCFSWQNRGVTPTTYTRFRRITRTSKRRLRCIKVSVFRVCGLGFRVCLRLLPLLTVVNPSGSFSFFKRSRSLSAASSASDGAENRIVLSSYCVRHAGHRPCVWLATARSMSWCQHQAQIWYPQWHGLNRLSVASSSLQHNGQSSKSSSSPASGTRRDPLGGGGWCGPGCRPGPGPIARGAGTLNRDMCVSCVRNRFGNDRMPRRYRDRLVSWFGSAETTTPVIVVTPRKTARYTSSPTHVTGRY